jgi:hypothetical protein
MMEQLLRDPNIELTDEVLKSVLEDIYDTYEAFVKRASELGVNIEWRYYNDGKVWLAKGIHKWNTSRGTIKEKTVFWGGIFKGFFRITVFFKDTERESLKVLHVQPAIKTFIEENQTMGKLKSFPLVFDIRMNEQLDDALTVIAQKKRLL